MTMFDGIYTKIAQRWADQFLLENIDLMRHLNFGIF